MNGFQLSERILEFDINFKICYIIGEINRDALRRNSSRLLVWDVSLKSQLRLII
jgi:hypothetical protein